MEEKKYRLLENEAIVVDGRTLYRIEALRDFGNVTAGDKGGFVESEENLSQYGNCWVYENAKAYLGSRVYGNAKLYTYASVYDNAVVCENARLFFKARVFGGARIFGSSMVAGEAEVHGWARVHDSAMVYGEAKVFDIADVKGRSEVCGNAGVTGIEDYIVFKNWWSSGRYFTWTRSNNMWRVGCFYGTGDDLVKKAYSDSERSGREYERIVRYVEEILKDGNKD